MPLYWTCTYLWAVLLVPSSWALRSTGFCFDYPASQTSSWRHWISTCYSLRDHCEVHGHPVSRARVCIMQRFSSETKQLMCFRQTVGKKHPYLFSQCQPVRVFFFHYLSRWPARTRANAVLLRSTRGPSFLARTHLVSSWPIRPRSPRHFPLSCQP